MKARILIVEDESIVQLDLQQRLQSLGHEVAGIARSGLEAIAMALQLRPDLIIMDIKLEGLMDGVEAARQIHANQQTPVIYLTAFASSMSAPDRANSPGPSLSKPFLTSELQSAIGAALGDTRARMQDELSRGE